MTPLALLFSFAFLVFVDTRILAPLMPSISASLGSSPGTVGLAMTTYSVAYGLGQLFYGPLSDRSSRIAVVRTAGIGFVAFTILSALAVTAGQFVGARLLAGTFAAAVIPLTLVYIGDTVPYEKRQAVIGRFSVITSSAMAFSAAIGGTVAHFVSWRLMLLGYGMLALVPIALLWRIRPSPPTGIPEIPVRFGEILRDHRAQFVYTAVFLEGFLLWGGITYLGSFAAQRYGIDQFAVGLLIALFGIGTMTGGLMMGRLRSRLSENTLAAVGGTLAGLSFLALIPRGSLFLFAAGMFFMGLGFVSLHTTLQVRGTEIRAEARGKAFSLFAFNLFVGIAAGSAALGVLVDAGNYEAMLAIAGVGLIGIGFVTALSPSKTPS